MSDLSHADGTLSLPCCVFLADPQIPRRKGILVWASIRPHPVLCPETRSHTQTLGPSRDPPRGRPLLQSEILAAGEARVERTSCQWECGRGRGVKRQRQRGGETGSGDEFAAAWAV
jgi:hypothetical protein